METAIVRQSGLRVRCRAMEQRCYALRPGWTGAGARFSGVAPWLGRGVT
jgi:hypothetical protein